MSNADSDGRLCWAYVEGNRRAISSLGSVRCTSSARKTGTHVMEITDFRIAPDENYQSFMYLHVPVHVWVKPRFVRA